MTDFAEVQVRAYAIRPENIAQKRVWREEDGLDQEQFDREVAVDEARALVRKRREIAAFLGTTYEDYERTRRFAGQDHPLIGEPR